MNGLTKIHTGFTPVDRTKLNRFATRLQREGDRRQAALIRSILGQWALTGRNIDMAALAAAIEARQPERAVDIVLPQVGIIAPSGIAPALAGKYVQTRFITRDLFEEGFDLAEEGLPLEFRVVGNFDVQLPAATRFLERYQFDLIRQIDNRTRDGIRAILEAGFQPFVEGAVQFPGSGNPNVTARIIRESIGLTDNQMLSVTRFKQELVRAGVTNQKVIDQKLNLYIKRKKADRAKNIARTETIRALNVGQDENWRQAADMGLFDNRIARRVWIVTPDDITCQICRPIPASNESGVKLGEPFTTPVGPVMFPPAHPRCRCATVLIPDPGSNNENMPLTQRLPPMKKPKRGRGLKPVIPKANRKK